MQISISINKFLLEHTPLIHLRRSYGCFYIVMAGLSSCDRPQSLQNLKQLLSNPLQIKFADFLFNITLMYKGRKKQLRNLYFQHAIEDTSWKWKSTETKLVNIACLQLLPAALGIHSFQAIKRRVITFPRKERDTNPFNRLESDTIHAFCSQIVLFHGELVKEKRVFSVR